MTKQIDILDDQNYRAVLDHGFVGLVDHMGSDGAIVQAARVSYGAGTKTVREDRGLIRYLVRHRHTSPIEMCEVKLHLKLPIVVMRQLVRHRTASLNEYSGRYSEMTDEFYIPDLSAIQPQSKDNKQGRAGDTDTKSKAGVQWLMRAACETNYDIYRALLGERTTLAGDELPYDPYGEDALLADDFPGIAREMARMVLPVANYTELYWKQNLHNLLHLLKLRVDSHAQYEIRVFAEAIYQLVKPLFPLACEAWEDYVRDATTLSRMETELVGYLFRANKTAQDAFDDLLEDHNGLKNAAGHFGLSEREMREFAARFNINTD